jgi:uncharacterized protein YcfJ
MHISKTHKTAGAALATLTAALALAGAAAPAQADPLIPGVTGCGASGNKQAGGALLGAVAGGFLGNSVSGHNRTTGTVLGAAAGAAAGSAIGCQMQHSDEQHAAVANTQAAYGPQTYRHDGYELSSGVAPASYQRRGDTVVATTTVNLRAAPDQGSARVGKLRPGERLEALAQVRGSDWILVGRGGVGVGYVPGYYTRPDNARYAERY